MCQLSTEKVHVSKMTVEVSEDLCPCKREPELAEESMIFKWPSVDNGQQLIKDIVQSQLKP